MGEIDERLERGVALFRRAGDDDALLGAALLAFVGALEQFLDADLLARPELAEPDRAQLTQGRLGWARCRHQPPSQCHSRSTRARHQCSAAPRSSG